MRSIEVVAAIIEHEGRILATQRGYGQFKDMWEFPGGKIEKGESSREALVREIKEELAADIKVGDFVMTVEYDYPDFHLTMHCFRCILLSDGVTLLEHENMKWLTGKELDSVDWLPADIGVVEELKKVY